MDIPTCYLKAQTDADATSSKTDCRFPKLLLWIYLLAILKAQTDAAANSSKLLPLPLKPAASAYTCLD